MTSREIRLFDVTFKEASGQYRPGDVVHGTVLLDIGAPPKMKGVKLHLQGVSRVSWDEKRSYTKAALVTYLIKTWRYTWMSKS